MKFFAGVFIFSATIFFAGCTAAEKQETEPQINFSGKVDGHHYSVYYRGDSVNYQQAVDSIFKNVEAIFSLNSPVSVISRYNLFEKTDTLFCFADSSFIFGSVYDLSKEIQRKTGGYFDPTVYPVKRAWQILGQVAPDIEPDLDSLFQFVGYDSRVDMIEKMADGYRYVETQMRKADARIELDYGDFPYAYGLDLVDNYLKDRGLKNYSIAVDNVILCRDTLLDSLSTRKLGPIDSLLVDQRNLAFATLISDDKKKFIDPTYGYPVDNSIVYVAVLAPDAARAQAYAQAFMIMGVDAMGSFYENNPEEPVDAFVVFNVDGQNFTASTPGFDSAMIRKQAVPAP